VAANHVRLNESRFLPAWTGYSGFFDAGERKWMPLCPIERGNWPPDWIPLFHYPEKRFTLRFRGGILPSMCLLAACMEVAVKISRGSVWLEYRKRSFSLYFFAERMSLTTEPKDQAMDTRL